MNDDLLDRLLAAPDGRARLLLAHGSRGAGKTWWMDRAAEHAAAAGCAVVRIDARHEQVDPRALAAAAARSPWCVVIDDIDLLDNSARRAVRATVEATGGIAIASAGVSSAFEGALSVRIEPLPTAAVETLLRARGVAHRAAQRCALAAAGNPGLAVSLADGLSDAQRVDAAAVPELPRLASDVAVVLHSRLEPLGERTCRALVVAAADDDGDLVAIRAALRALGEAGTASTHEADDDPLAAVFDEAEQAGIVDIVGARVIFTDPWLRLAAYHLVAPASRRAAHRALAAAYSAPRQGEPRVRHLVAAGNGPSDAVAEALLTVAAAAARRGERLTAARLATQAAELSVTQDVRTASLLRAAAWWMDSGELREAERLVSELDGATAEEQAAAAEVAALLHGEADPAVSEAAESPQRAFSERELATWAGRREQRRAWWAAADGGAHAKVIHQVGSAAAPGELLARAVALRHGGFVRDAQELAERTLTVLPAADTHLRRQWTLLATDLAVLTGRGTVSAIEVSSPQWSALAARAVLTADPSIAAGPSLVTVPAGEPLHEVRSLLLRGLTTRDAQLVVAAAERADAASLPVEAGEAWLFAAELAAEGADGSLDAVAFAAQASERLHRCAVRGWDLRLHRLAERTANRQPSAAAPAADPALEGLSAAEWRVATAVAGGLTNREVAASLFLSVKTVDFHLQQIYRKLALRSRTELAVRVAGSSQQSAGHGSTGNRGALR